SARTAIPNSHLDWMGLLCPFSKRPPTGTHARSSARSRIELGIPVQEVAPALVQEVRRERAAALLQLERGRGARLAQRPHAAFLRQAVALGEIAAGAGRDHVGPAGATAARAGHQVVESQLRGGPAVAA